MPGYVNVPTGLIIPLDEEKIRSGDPEKLLEALSDLVTFLQEHLEQIASVVNAGPEFEESTTQPLPADNKLLVWKDISGAPVYKLLYGDGGSGYQL